MMEDIQAIGLSFVIWQQVRFETVICFQRKWPSYINQALEKKEGIERNLTHFLLCIRDTSDRFQTGNCPHSIKVRTRSFR